MEGESNYPSKVVITQLSICSNSTELQNSSNSFEERIVDSEFFTSQDKELVSILDDLQISNGSGPSNNTESTRRTGYFHLPLNLNKFF